MELYEPQTKNREGASGLNIDHNNNESRLTGSERDKAGVLGNCFASVFTVDRCINSLIITYSVRASYVISIEIGHYVTLIYII